MYAANFPSSSLRARKSRKGQRLDLVKCERCRDDKQKCLPIGRDWPGQRCDRCSEKGLPCSEGKRATRKPGPSRNLATAPRSVTAEKTPSEPRNSPVSVEDNFRESMGCDPYKWLFICLFYKLISGSLRRLQGLKKQIQDVFEMRQDKLFPSHEEDGSMSELHQFEKEFLALEDYVEVTSERLFTLPASEHTSWVIRTRAGLTLPERKFRFDFEKTRTCRVCDRIDQWKELLQRIPANRASETSSERRMRDAAVLYTKLLAIQKCPLHCFLDDYEDMDDPLEATRDKAQQMLEESRKVFGEATGPLAFIPPRLLRLTERGSFVPKGLLIQDWFREWMEDLTPENLNTVLDDQTYVDCIGRTLLHQFLDTFEFPAQALWLKELITEINEYSELKLTAINSADILGRTPLHIACQKNYLGMVKALLDAGADVTRKTLSDSLPLHYAAAVGAVEIVQRLLEIPGLEDAHYNSLDWAGHTPLYYAVGNSHIGAVRALVGHTAVDPDVHRKGTRPPLHEAIWRGNDDVFRALLDGGADPDAVSFGRTAVQLDRVRWEPTNIKAIFASY